MTPPTWLDRTISTLGWYSPELTLMAVAGGIGLAIWWPLALVSVGVLAWIVGGRAYEALSNRAYRRRVARRQAEQARLDAAHTGDGEVAA